MNSRIFAAIVLAGSTVMLSAYDPGAQAAPVSSSTAALMQQQPAAVLPTEDSALNNAAFLYYRAWTEWDYVFLDIAKIELKLKTDADWRLTEDETKRMLVLGAQGFIEEIIKSSHVEKADFGIDRSQGLGMWLPHLNLLRSTGRCLAVDARRCIAEGKIDDAAERIAAIYRLARHASSDGVLISGLVSCALRTMADGQVDLLLTNAGMLSVQARDTLLVEARRMSEPDACGIKAGFEQELEWYLPGGWMHEHWKGADAGQQFIKVMDGNLENPEHEASCQLDEQQLAYEMERAASALNAMLEVWDAPDAMPQLVVIHSMVDQGHFGPVARLVCPSIGNSPQQRQIRTDAEHTAVVQRLAGVSTFVR